MAVSVVGHGLVLTALLMGRAEPPRAAEPEPMNVTLFELPPPPPPPLATVVEQPEPDKPAPISPPPRKAIFRETPVPRDAAPLAAGEAVRVAEGAEVSDAEVAGAATAGTGPPGGVCDMPARLQAALRKDRLVQAAVAQAHLGRPILVWNGDWVRRGDQEGHGLAAVREAIMWEVGFAPPACRSQPVKGLVLITLDDLPGAPRLVVGAGAWRWSDLLFARSTPRGG